MHWVRERLIPLSVGIAIIALLCVAGGINAAGH